MIAVIRTYAVKPYLDEVVAESDAMWEAQWPIPNRATLLLVVECVSPSTVDQPVGAITVGHLQVDYVDHANSPIPDLDEAISPGARNPIAVAVGHLLNTLAGPCRGVPVVQVEAPLRASWVNLNPIGAEELDGLPLAASPAKVAVLPIVAQVSEAKLANLDEAVPEADPHSFARRTVEGRMISSGPLS